MTTMNPAAAAARETHRSSIGQFGTQPLSEADVDLSPVHTAPVDPALTAPPMTFHRGPRDSGHQLYTVEGAGPNVRRLTAVSDEHGRFLQVDRQFDYDQVAERCVGEDHPDPFAWKRTRNKDIEEIVAAHDPGFGQRLQYYYGDYIEAESVDNRTLTGGSTDALTAVAARAAAIPIEDIVVEGLQKRSVADAAAGREVAGEHAQALTDEQAEVVGRTQRIMAPRLNTLTVTPGGTGGPSNASIVWTSNLDPELVHTDEVDTEGLVVRSAQRRGEDETKAIMGLGYDIAPIRWDR